MESGVWEGAKLDWDRGREGAICRHEDVPPSTAGKEAEEAFTNTWPRWPSLAGVFWEAIKA